MKDIPAKDKTYSSPEFTGGRDGASGYQFQDAYIVSQIPIWLNDPEFSKFRKEGAEDVEVIFIRNRKEIREGIQVKKRKVTPRVFRKVIKRFQMLDVQAPGTYTKFILVCRDFSDDLRKFLNHVKDYQNNIITFGRDQLEKGSWRELREEAANIDIQDDLEFIFQKVNWDTDTRSLDNSSRLLQSFIEKIAFSKSYFMYLPSAFESAFKAFDSVFKDTWFLVSRSPRIVVERGQLHKIIMSNVSAYISQVSVEEVENLKEAKRQQRRNLALKLAFHSKILERISNQSLDKNLSSRSVLLAVESMKRYPSIGADLALRTSIESHCKTKKGGVIDSYDLENPVTSVIFSPPDGKYLAIRSEGNALVLWKISIDKEIIFMKHDDVIRTVAFSSNGEYLATGSDDKTARVWSITGDMVTSPLEHREGVTSIAFSPDNQYLATASYDGVVRIWNCWIKGKQKPIELLHKAEVWAVVFSPKGEYVASASFDKTARVWEIKTGKSFCIRHYDDVRTLVFSSDGRYLASASSDGIIKVREITGRRIFSLPHKSEVLAISFSPDGKHLAAACAEKESCIWEVETKIKLWNLPHGGKVNDIVFSPDGQRLATACSDRTARIWKVNDGEQITCMYHDNVVNSIAFSPFRWGRCVATASGGIDEIEDIHDESEDIIHDYSARLWFWKPKELITEACDLLNRNLSDEEWNQYLGKEKYKPTCRKLPQLE